MRGIYLVRHGNTTYDTKVDALLNPPLDQDGVERIERTVKFLDSRSIKPARIISSPLQRALAVAEKISRGNIKVTTYNGCLPWNLGDLMGKEGAFVADKLDYLKAYPDIRAPHGESYRDFYNRWEGTLRGFQAYAEAKDQDLLITTHSRNINALQSIIGGNPVGQVEESAPESSVTLLALTGSGDWIYELIWDGR